MTTTTTTTNVRARGFKAAAEKAISELIGETWTPHWSAEPCSARNGWGLAWINGEQCDVTVSRAADKTYTVEIASTASSDEPAAEETAEAAAMAEYNEAVAARDAAQARRDEIGASPVTSEMTPDEIREHDEAFAAACDAFEQACRVVSEKMSAALEAGSEAATAAEPAPTTETVHREYCSVTLEELADAMRGVPEAIFMYRPQIPDLVQKAASNGALTCFKSYDLDGEMHSYALRVRADQNGCTPDRFNVYLDGEHTVTFTEPAAAPETLGITMADVERFMEEQPGFEHVFTDDNGTIRLDNSDVTLYVTPLEDGNPESPVTDLTVSLSAPTGEVLAWIMNPNEWKLIDVMRFETPLAVLPGAGRKADILTVLRSLEQLLDAWTCECRRCNARWAYEVNIDPSWIEGAAQMVDAGHKVEEPAA